MRISDWSSDVCSSDLPAAAGQTMAPGQPVAPPLPEPSSTSEPSAASGEPVIVKGPDGTTWEASSSKEQEAYQADIEDCYRYASAQTRRDAQFIDDRNAGIDRSEEHTSELQSLRRIPY